MQVSHASSNVTAAVIGSQERCEFRISNSPEFFHILSSSLYSNPRVAVIREILCNAWDAHKDADISSPVTVILTTDNLTIRDYGKGIAPENMADIYGIYGASTKQNDSNQTGGFGLGCKAPFAYTDSFKVISYHKGTKTIYQMLKSSLDTDGRPAIVQIAQLPTEESGLEVSIPIEFSDYSYFQNYIINIANLAGQDITYNQDLYKSSYAHLPLGFAYIPSCNFSFLKTSWIYIKYGNVIYPLEKYSNYSNEYSEIYNFFNIFRVCNNVLIEAEPDSLVLTPSRESLQYCAKTINTIKQLFNKTLVTIDKIKEQSHKVFKSILAQKEIDLFSSFYSWINYPKEIVTFEDACTMWAMSSLSAYKDYADVYLLKFKEQKPKQAYLARSFEKNKAKDKQWVYKHIYRVFRNPLFKQKNFYGSEFFTSKLRSVYLLNKMIYLVSSKASYDNLFDKLAPGYKVVSSKNAREVKEYLESKGWTVDDSLLNYVKVPTVTTKKEKRDLTKLPKTITVYPSKSFISSYSTVELDEPSITEALKTKTELKGYKYVIYRKNFQRASWVHEYLTKLVKYFGHQIVFVKSETALKYCKKYGLLEETDVMQEIYNKLSNNKSFIQYIKNNIAVLARRICRTYYVSENNFIVKNNLEAIRSFFNFLDRNSLYKEFGIIHVSELDPHIEAYYKIYTDYCNCNRVTNPFKNISYSKKARKKIVKLLYSNLYLMQFPYCLSAKDKDCSSYVDWFKNVATKRSKYA